jgi:alkylation response protein AidB-like acyl-CoA dehydrogenase
MNFEYSPEENALHVDFQAGVAALVDAAAPGSPAERHAAVRANLTVLGRLGYLALQVPVTEGGRGLSALVALPFHQAVARACASTFAAAEASAFTVGALLVKAGTPEQKAAWLPGLLAGTALAAFAITEGPAGSDLSATATTATRRAGGWTLSGAKTMVANAPMADVALVLAAVDPAAAADTGLALFLVPRGTPGACFGPTAETMGLKGMALGDLTLSDCALPDAALLGVVGEGLGHVHDALQEGCLRYAAFSLGLAAACLDLGLERATTRLSGGKPIFRHQEVSFKLADMHALTDTALQLTRHAAWAHDRRDAKAPTLIEASKLLASEAVARSANLALQVHGGLGYLASCPVERLYRDARYAELAKVSSELLRVRLASDVLRSAT